MIRYDEVPNVWVRYDGTETLVFIARAHEGGGGHVMQDDVIDRILTKLPDATREQLFERGWLDVEEAYRRKGWTVEYDKPGFNESYRASFTFSPRRSP